MAYPVVFWIRTTVRTDTTTVYSSVNSTCCGLTGQYQVDQESKSTYTVIWILRPKIITIYIVMLSVNNTIGTTWIMEIEYFIVL